VAGSSSQVSNAFQHQLLDRHDVFIMDNGRVDWNYEISFFMLVDSSEDAGISMCEQETGQEVTLPINFKG
jgi:hypothetical protein